MAKSCVAGTDIQGRSPWLAGLAIVLVLAAFLTGCVGPPRHADARPELLGRDASQARAGDDDGSGRELRHHGDFRAFMFAVGCFVIAVTVVVDLIILPCTWPYDHPFCCTREVVVVCFE